jgi:predicted metalloprotease with PDZ domain
MPRAPKATVKSAPVSAHAPVHYRVTPADVHAHHWQVLLTLTLPAAIQRLQLPVWISGSYMVREFSKHLQGLECRQAGRICGLTQVDKATWDVQADPDQVLEISYTVYALDNSVRSAWLDSARGFFNATSLCLMAQGFEDGPQLLEVLPAPPHPSWQLATGLPAQRVDRRGFGVYRAADYDELADCPVEMGDFWSAEFTACGVVHRFVVAGALPSFDGERLLRDTQKICEAAIRFWHGAAARAADVPFASYTFLLNAVDDNYGGLEHRNSTALIAARRDLPRLGEAKTSEGYTTLLGLISHEYFHTWNVKRLRPADFARYDYTRENYTDLLWFFEGFTSYYDDLLLRRAGLIDDTAYVRLLNKTINQVLQAPGRKVQSVAQASFDAWVKYYRQDENTPNATISYYQKGALVGLCIDLTLRREGTATLDDVMRGLWQRCQGGPMQEADVLAVLQSLSGRSWAKEIKVWVHGTGELPLRPLLESQDILVYEDPAQPAQRLGLRVTETAGVLRIKTVLHGSAAQRAGLCAGDEWLGVGLPSGGWRIHKLDELGTILGSARRCVALVSRDKQLLRLPLTLPARVTTWRLAAGSRAPTAWPA